MTETLVQLDVRSPAFKADPHPRLAAALQKAPVSETRLPIVGRMHVAVSHAAVQEVLKDTDRFAVNARNAGHRHAFGLPFMPKSIRLMADNILAMDDPDHLRLRRLVDTPFRRTNIDSLRTVVAEQVMRVLDEWVASENPDFVKGFCQPLPLAVISDILGLTGETRTRLMDLMHRFSGTSSTLGIIWAMTRLGGALELLRKEIAGARARPRDGLLSELVQAGGDDERMSEDELVSMVLVLFVAGHETTMNLLSAGLYTLLTEPGAWETALGLSDDDWRIAVDELMRFCGPVQFTKPRFVKEDTEFHGVKLKRGGKVMALLAAANLDPEVFDDPLVLDLARRPNRHQGWGGGPHICLGLHLAKMEAELAFAEIVRRWPKLSPGRRIEWSKRMGVRGLAKMELAGAVS